MSTTASPMASPIVSVQQLVKTYASGHQALRGVDLDIHAGEIFALLGPNGAGKTTLISIICGLVTPTSGQVLVGGHNVVTDYRAARSAIGLVPQELTTDAFETVWNTVTFSRGLFGKAPDPGHIERILKQLSLWDKRHSTLRTLSGGMKRRVLIAKALSHEPRVLFLDEPTAGVDVTLRREMWDVVRELRRQGVTIILTTHYLEEAEDMADRIGVINHGQLVLLEDKHTLLQRLGQKQLVVDLTTPVHALPAILTPYNLTMSTDGHRLTYTYAQGGTGAATVAPLLAALGQSGLPISDVQTSQSSLEDIFINLTATSQA